MLNIETTKEGRLGKLRTRRSELASIDELIVEYLTLHNF